MGWDANQVPTRDKKFIFVDSLRSLGKSLIRLAVFLSVCVMNGGPITNIGYWLDGGETRNAVAENDLIELIRTSNRTPGTNREFSGRPGST